MTELVQRGQLLGMRFSQAVVDPGQLGSLELLGPLAGAAAGLVGWLVDGGGGGLQVVLHWGLS